MRSEFHALFFLEFSLEYLLWAVVHCAVSKQKVSSTKKCVICPDNVEDKAS